MNQPPLNPDGVMNAMDTLMAETDADERATDWARKVTARVLEGYFAVALPEVTSVEELDAPPRGEAMSILEILEDHRQYSENAKDTRFYCLCGWVSEMPRYGHGQAEHRAHVAQVLEQHEQEAKAAAYEYAANRLLEEADFQEDLYRRNGRSEFIHAAVRMTVIEHEMRRFAAQLKETP